jgi:hypothetical protein
MDIWVLNLFEIPKLSFVFLLIIGVFLGILKSEFIVSSLFAALLLINYIGVAPAVGVGFSLFLLWQTKSIVKTIKMGLPFFAIAFFIGLFYVLMNLGGVSNSTLETFPLEYETAYLKTSFNIIVKAIIQITITTLPLIILLVFLRKKLTKPILTLLSLVAIVSFSAILIWSALFKMFDSVQFWVNVYIPLINILGVIILFLFYSNLKNETIKKTVLASISIISIIVYFGLNIHSNKEVEKLNFSVLNPNSNFAFLKKNTEYKGVFDNMDHIYSGHVFSLMRKFDPLKIVWLNPNETKLSDSRYDLPILSRSTMYKYANSLKENGKFRSWEDTQLQFIEQFKIDFLLLPPEREMPKHLKSKFKKTDIIIDDYLIYKKINHN